MASILLAGPRFVRQVRRARARARRCRRPDCARWASRRRRDRARRSRPEATLRRVGARPAVAHAIQPVGDGGRAVVAPVAATAARVARSLRDRDRNVGRGQPSCGARAPARRRVATTPSCTASRKRRPAGSPSRSRVIGCVVAIAIEGLAAELAGGTISGPLLRARGQHPWLGRRAYPRADSLRDSFEPVVGRGNRARGRRRRRRIAVYFGVPVPALTRPPRAHSAAVFSTSGRLVKEKGAHLLLEGVARARERDPGSR